MKKPSHFFLFAFCLVTFAAPRLATAAWNHFDPANPASVPKKFSQTGFYSNWQSKVVTAEAKHFDVNTPLWSDHAIKNRWILLKPGSVKVKFDPETDYFEYPDGAVFVKLFQQDTIPGNPASRIFWETRVLVNKKSLDSNSMTTHDYWHSFSYRWKPDGSEADLVPVEGFDTSLTLWVNGQKSFRKWVFPSVGDCNRCHRQYDVTRDAVQGRTVLGFFTPQLNRPSEADPQVNQIIKLFQEGIFTSPTGSPVQADLSQFPKWARVEDETADLDLRARAYIASNCSGCHGSRGLATNATPHVTQLDYDFFKMTGGKLVPAMELRDIPVGIFDLQALTTGSKSVNPALIVPGYPELSVLLYRQSHRNRKDPADPEGFAPDPAQMPPVGVYEVDTNATQMLAEWIRSMQPLSIKKRASGFDVHTPRVIDGIVSLRVPANTQVKWIALNGQSYRLESIGEGRYRLPAGLANGLYMLDAGGRLSKVVLK